MTCYFPANPTKIRPTQLEILYRFTTPSQLVLQYQHICRKSCTISSDQIPSQSSISTLAVMQPLLSVWKPQWPLAVDGFVCRKRLLQNAIRP